MKTCHDCRHTGQCGISSSPRRCAWFKPSSWTRGSVVLRAIFWIMTALLIGAVLAILLVRPAHASECGMRSAECGVNNKTETLDSRDLAEMKRLEAIVAEKIKFPSPQSSPRRVEDVNAWTAGDTALQAVFLTTLAIDRGQTVAGQEMKRDEVGWARHFIGSHPSSGQVNRYFATCAMLHTAVAIVLPKPYREIWQSFWIGVEVSTVDSNVNAGISVRF